MRRHEGEETPLNDDVLIRRAVAERLYIDGERATAPYCTYHLVNAIVAIAGTVLFHARSEYCTLQRVAPVHCGPSIVGRIAAHHSCLTL